MLGIIRALKKKELLTPVVIVLSFLVVLSLIIILGQFFHQSLQQEMAEQFNQQQLLLARQVALNIDSFIDHVYEDIHVISHLIATSTDAKTLRYRNAVDVMDFKTPSSMLVTIRVVDENGIVQYDRSFPGTVGKNISSSDFFKKARLLPENEKLITDLLPAPGRKPDSKQFIVATPIYTRSARHHASEFKGIVLALLSLDEITQHFLSPIKSGSGGYAWMMDSEGTLLYHPKQPSMVGRNLYHTDQSCFQCHISFDTEKKMIEGKSETFGSYEAPGGENKLAAFYKFSVARKSWIVVVSAPYSDVIALMQRSKLFYSLLILSIFITTIGASGATIINYKKKIQAEERAMHLENHQRLERQIEITKNYLENIIENTKTNIMVLDKDLIVRTVNTAQAQTFNRAKQELVGKPFFSLFPVELDPYEGIPLEALLRKSIDGRSYELKDYRIAGIPDGPIFLNMNVSPILIDGAIPGALLTSTNVTKRVELEEALKLYTVELEDKVVEGTATAKKLEQQVMHSEKLAALGRLAAGVAHEIGNPLTSISTFAQLLKDTAQDEFTQNSLSIINNHIQRITEIVRRMSTFSRADATNIKSTQINDVLKSTLDLMRLDKRLKETIGIEMNLDPGLPKTMIDEGQLSQVFINLFLNAFDAMPEGGNLSVSTSQGKDDHGKDSILIEFADSGIGISEHDITKIFDPFYTTKEAGKGTGLGLSLSYNIIKTFKGDIKVESEPGKKTVFTILIPIEQG